jgi:hypothetical protein
MRSTKGPPKRPTVASLPTPTAAGPPAKRLKPVGTGVHLTGRSLVKKRSPERPITVKSVKRGGVSYRFSGSHIARRVFEIPRFGTFFSDRCEAFFSC